MKNVPRKCPLCKDKLSRDNSIIECLACNCFIVQVDETGIIWWSLYFSDCGWSIESNGKSGTPFWDGVPAPRTVLRDQDDDVVLELQQWYPYKTRNFLKDTTKLLDRLLNLKAFA